MAESEPGGAVQIHPVRVEDTGRGTARIWGACGTIFELSTNGQLAEQLVRILGANINDADQSATSKNVPGGDGWVVQIATKLSLSTKVSGCFEIEVQNMDGGLVPLLVMPQSTVLQIKRAVAQAEGTPAFQQALWAEGAEEELQNKQTAAESGLHDKSVIFLIKGDAASWQVAMLHEPKLFEALGDFMALSTWRDEGGYEHAGKTMEAMVEEWESSAELSQLEVLRRKVVVGKFFVDCGGQFDKAITLLEDALATLLGSPVHMQNAEGEEEAEGGEGGEGGEGRRVHEEEEKEEADNDDDEEEEEATREGGGASEAQVVGGVMLALPTADQARLHMALGAAYAGREAAKQFTNESVWPNHKRAVEEYEVAVELYCTHHTVLTILHSPYCTHHTRWRWSYTVLTILHSPHCTHHTRWRWSSTVLTILYSSYCTHHTVLTILYSPYCTHHTRWRWSYTVLTILYSPYCTHHTVLIILGGGGAVEGDGGWRREYG
jgi:hypothetical protein